MVRASHLFLRELDLMQIGEWKYKVEDSSLTTRLYTPVWEKLATLMPRSVAPNVVTLCAFVCIMQAFWITVKYGFSEDYHSSVCIGAALLIYAHMTLDAIDGIHARNTMNNSPLGEFFDHGLDNISGTFLTLTFLILIGVETPDTRWYLVQVSQLASISVHIAAFGHKDRKIKFGCFTGPGELLHAFIFLLIVAGLCGKEVLWHQTRDLVLIVHSEIQQLLGSGDPVVPAVESSDALATALLARGAAVVYWASNVLVVTQVLLLHGKYFATKFGFLLSLAMRAVPALLLLTNITRRVDVSLESTISDGLFLSILCSDIIVAKMANRDLHSLVPVIAMASVVSNFVVYGSVALYHITVIFDMCMFLNLPLVNPVINVYCDGIFDLLHLGHKMQFKQAMEVSNGTRLFVGVINDKDATDYKRKPILTEEERYASVQACKYVHKVIRDAPLVAGEDFIKENQLHVYAIGEEYYDDPKDHYYAVPRKMGILMKTSRTGGISTSELIKRIQDRDTGQLARVAPAKLGI